LTPGTVIHHAALAVAVASLLGAGIRVASLAAPSGLERVIAAVVLAAATAVVETLGLGLVSLGASPVALVAAALATWLATRLFLPAPAVSVAAELTRWARRLTSGESLTVLAVAGAAAADGYVERHGRATETASRVVVWLAGQPRWRDRRAPVASTFSLLAPLAGDRLRHRLVLVEDRTACGRAAALRAWLVITLRGSERPIGCGAPQHADGDVSVYAPPG
jgi:hypothetical protein